MWERAKDNLELTRKKLVHARDFSSKKDLAESIHYIWVVFENCVNIFLDLKSDSPTHRHKSKVEVLSLYHSLFFLKKDYSETFAILLKLRIRADFGDYAQVPRIPEEAKVKEFLKEAEELFLETEKAVESFKQKK